MCTVSSFFFPSSNGVSDIHAVCWTPDGPLRAVVQLSHGICEHIGRYDDFARFLCGQGILVVGNDHLGHGDSFQRPEERGIFAEHDGWRHVVDDLEQLRARTAAQHPGLPYFLLGHSMGSFLARTYLIRYPGRVTGALLCGTGQQSPLLVAGGRALCALLRALRGPRHVSTAVQRMAFGAYNRAFEPRRTDSDWLTRDEELLDEHLRDARCAFVPTVSLFGDMLGGIAFISKQENVQKMDLHTPVYFFSGAMDPVGEQGQGVLRAVGTFNRAGCDELTVRLYGGARHELLNETCRAQVYAEVLDWLERHMERVRDVG